MRHFPDEEERSWAVKLFWSIYVLDHRLSFGTGMPFAVQDADIDPWLPEPVRATKIIMMISREADKSTGRLFTISEGHGEIWSNIIESLGVRHQI